MFMEPHERHLNMLNKRAERNNDQASKGSGPKTTGLPRSSAERLNMMKANAAKRREAAKTGGKAVGKGYSVNSNIKSNRGKK